MSRWSVSCLVLGIPVNASAGIGWGTTVRNHRSRNAELMVLHRLGTVNTGGGTRQSPIRHLQASGVEPLFATITAEMPSWWYFTDLEQWPWWEALGGHQSGIGYGTIVRNHRSRDAELMVLYKLGTVNTGGGTRRSPIRHPQASGVQPLFATIAAEMPSWWYFTGFKQSPWGRH